MGTIIVHDPERLAVFARPIATPYETFEDYDEERCNQLLRETFRGKPYKLLHRSVWKMTAQVAERFRHRNVFLVGDAAHRFPPTGGLGLNSGAGDVHNLVWKLASVLAGDLDESTQEPLLESYQQERKPVAQANCDVSLRNSQKMMEVIEAIGLDPAKANLLPKLMSSFLVRILPEGLRRGLRNLLQKPVHARLLAAAADNPRGREIRENVARATANQEEHFNSFGLDLGYVYREGCAVSSEAKTTPANSVTTYDPIAAAGARLPHVPIRVAGQTRSTLDLLSYDGFTLFKSGAAPGLQQSTFNLPVAEVDIADSDFKESFDSLSKAFKLDPGGWILVRPDGHVMTRSTDHS
jgi:2,4-dichlorophenol 6-monooxygenase